MAVQANGLQFSLYWRTKHVDLVRHPKHPQAGDRGSKWLRSGRWLRAGNDVRLHHRGGQREGAALVIADLSQIAVMAAKDSVNRSFESGLSDGVMFERRLFYSLFATVDQKEGMDAFLNKRKAIFIDG